MALPLPGPHFMMNFLAAAAVAHALGVAPEAMAAAVAGVHPGQAPKPGAPPRAGRRAHRRLLQLEPRGPRRRASPPCPWREASAGWPCSATCSSSGPEAARDPRASAAARYAEQLELLATVGPLGREIAEGACRAGLPEGAVHLFDDAAAAAAAAARPRASPATPCSSRPRAA